MSDYIFQFDEFQSLAKKADLTVKVNKSGYVFFADNETLGNNLLGYINPNIQNQKLHISVPIPTTATLDEFEDTKDLIDFLKSEESHYKHKFESKESARKSIKESRKIGYIRKTEYEINGKNYSISDNGKLFKIIDDLDSKGFTFKYESEWISKDICKHFLAEDDEAKVDLYK